MSDVVRYTPNYDKHKMVVIDRFTDVEDGEWICATDYQALADQLEKLIVRHNAACESYHAEKRDTQDLRTKLAAVMEDAKIESQRRQRAEQKLEACEASIAQAVEMVKQEKTRTEQLESNLRDTLRLLERLDFLITSASCWIDEGPDYMPTKRARVYQKGRARYV